MGHSRLGRLPNTLGWQNVVGLIAIGGDVAQIADATMAAADRGLQLAFDDRGFCHVMWLLSKLALAARQADFSGALYDVGMHCPSEPGMFDIVGGFSDAVDDHLRHVGGRTDIGEMAQLAAVECLTAQISDRSASLFETSPADVQQAVHSLSTKNGFSSLAHDFFSRFTHRYLMYHLGRELSNHVGSNGRFTNPTEHTEFVAQLGDHCREAALIVRDFSGGWYSKANYEDGISQAKARNYTNVALKKLQKELKVRGGRDDK
jgi:hypothetical protein